MENNSGWELAKHKGEKLVKKGCRDLVSKGVRKFVKFGKVEVIRETEGIGKDRRSIIGEERWSGHIRSKTIVS